MPTPTEIYKANVSLLQAQLNAKIRNINLMRISIAVKKTRIANTMNEFNYHLKNLTDKYNQDMTQAITQAITVTPIAKKQTALLVGVNYVGTSNELYGCINDTKNVQDLLKTKYNFTNHKN